MKMRIKINAAEYSVEIDGTKFDMPASQGQRDGFRELVVNYFCKTQGFPLLYPNAEAYLD